MVGVREGAGLLIKMVEAETPIGVKLGDFKLEVAGERATCRIVHVDRLRELLDRLLISFLLELSVASLFDH